MMLLREPQSLRRHPSLGDPAADMSLRVVAAALGRRACQRLLSISAWVGMSFLRLGGSDGQPDTCCVSGAGSLIRSSSELALRHERWGDRDGCR
jgi:hypothetical protein